MVAGFCSYCGEPQSRCRCVHASKAAPAVSVHRLRGDKAPRDSWSRTYTQPAPQKPKPADNNPPQRRFPRPLSQTQVTQPPTPSGSRLDNRVSEYIASTTSQIRRPSQIIHPAPAPEDGVLPSLSGDSDSPTLTKVYGSLLSHRTEDHRCVICSSPFLPDDTIYPQVKQSANPGFLCRSCFIANGGTKGICANCNDPVLILKSEGGFVEVSDTVYHKYCFTCEGCGKNIGDKPSVDLLGRPCCSSPECFDTCLSRKPARPAASQLIETHAKEDARNMFPSKKRQGSPALEELSQRLQAIGDGSRSRSQSPKRQGLSESVHTNESTPRPSRKSVTVSMEAVEEMKRRFSVTGSTTSGSPAISSRLASPSTPDLVSDNSDSTTLSSSYSGSPMSSRSNRHTVDLTPSKSLKGFDSFDSNRSLFPSSRDSLTLPASASLPAQFNSSPRSSSRFELPPLESPTKSNPFSRPDNKCPGCRKTAFPMERGVVTGPHATKWHASCLVCSSPECRKPLDSAAKRDREGSVWCRTCSLKLPSSLKGSPIPSPSRTPVSPDFPVTEGQTTIARQNTGHAIKDSALIRQMTGAGMEKGRSLSPTKQMFLHKKRSAKSVDEGRGMLLVRQMTGGR